MIVLGIDVPLVELAFASMVIIIVILGEIIIIALLTSKQLTLSTLFNLPPPASRPTPLLPKISTKTPTKLPPAKSPLPSAPPTPPKVLHPGKLTLDRELARVQEQLSTLPSYTPQPGVIKTELPSTGHSAAPDGQRLEQQAKEVNRLLEKMGRGQSRSSSPKKEEKEARAYREVQQISRKVEAQKPAPKSELVRLDEELARLRKEIQSTPSLKSNTPFLKSKKA